MPGIQSIRSNLNLKVLNPAELAEIKSATLHVLEHVGVRFPSERALRVFADHGAWVNPDSQVVKLPAELVLEAMHHAPRSYTLGGRAEWADLPPRWDKQLFWDRRLWGRDGRFCDGRTTPVVQRGRRPDGARVRLPILHLLLLADGKRAGLRHSRTATRIRRQL